MPKCLFTVYTLSVFWSWNLLDIEELRKSPRIPPNLAGSHTPIPTCTVKFCSSSTTTMDSFPFNTSKNWWAGRIFLDDLLVSNRELYQNLFPCVCPALYHLKQSAVWSLQAAFFHIPQTCPELLNSFMLLWQVTENMCFFLLHYRLSSNELLGILSITCERSCS